ncbi:MAG: hypothetical protein IT384_10855 [Deltaproteobacteria bacterium]|nr:hypothetical protein [Deltaproteobacteria bacterium]
MRRLTTRRPTTRRDRRIEIDRRTLMRALSAAPLAAALAGCRESAVPVGRDDAGAGHADAARSSAILPDAAPNDAEWIDAGGSDGGVLDDAARADAGEETCAPTGSDVQGPFYRPGAPDRAELTGPNEPGDRLEITGVVLGQDCRPLSGAVLDVWHADAAGRYDNASIDYRLRAVLMTAQAGAFSFRTVRPGNYPDAGGMRPAHIHFTVTHPGHASLTTQLYFAGDPYLAPNDSCGGCNSSDPTLITTLTSEMRAGVAWWVGRFEVVLREA